MAALPELIARLERALWHASVSGSREHFYPLKEAVEEALEVLREVRDGTQNP